MSKPLWEAQNDLHEVRNRILLKRYEMSLDEFADVLLPALCRLPFVPQRELLNLQAVERFWLASAPISSKTDWKTRHEQGPFREAVFRAYDGRCAVSGCAVPEALEAAHLLGRDWRQGHNRATDGILLRRDLHNLYDRGLLRISDAGQVELSGDVLTYYGEFNGAAVTRIHVQTAT